MRIDTPRMASFRSLVSIVKLLHPRRCVRSSSFGRHMSKGLDANVPEGVLRFGYSGHSDVSFGRFRF